MILYKCSSYSRPSELHGYQRGSENRTAKRIRVLGPEQEMSMHIQVQRILELKRAGELEPFDHTGEVETVVISHNEFSGMLSELKVGPSTNTGLR